MPRIFVSHCHKDKSIARRIVRFLRAYTVDTWLDERELPTGSRLDDAIRMAIGESDAVIVVATREAACSPWVEREVTFACDSIPAIKVYPVYIHDVIDHPSFAPHLGFDAKDQHQFADVLVRLAETFVGCPLPQPDMKEVEAGLDELSRQSPGVALLVDSCLRGEGLAYEHVRLVSEVPFHDLDDALDVISRLGGGHVAAHATAVLFSRTGAGSAALSRYILAGHNILVHAIGTVLDAPGLNTATRLLSLPSTPDDQALASFLWENAAKLAGNYRAEVVRLVTHPRRGPTGFGADMAAAAFSIFPDDDDLVLLWSRWIREGCFDPHSESGGGVSRAFAYWCTKGLQSGSGGWSRVFDSFLYHVRRLARTKSKLVVYSALKHMMFAAEKNNPRLAEIVRECQAAIGAAEWDGWEERDEMIIYVSELTTEALGEHRWSEASRRAKESLEAMRALEQSILEQGKRES